MRPLHVYAYATLLRICHGPFSNRLRRLPEKDSPECDGFSLVFKAWQPAHSRLCNGWHNAEDGRKDKQAAMSFDRDRLNPMEPSRGEKEPP